jgi:hypothetical protein
VENGEIVGPTVAGEPRVEGRPENRPIPDGNRVVVVCRENLDVRTN